MRLIQKLFFRLRGRVSHLVFQTLRKFYWRMQGLQIGSGTILPEILVTWPHQVFIGKDCKLENGIFFKFDGIWQPGPSISIGDRSFVGAYVEFNIREGIEIGTDCLIASGCKFIDHDHGFSNRDETLNKQVDGIQKAIVLENDVWLGVNVVVLKGVKIGQGSIVAAGSVVTKSIPSYEVWAGIPAKKISVRP